MPRLARPDGVEIFWDERGSGPLVVISNQYAGYPGVFEGLIAELASDHRVVFYDLRGNGRSSRQGPYDFPTDAADLEAVIEATGPPAVLLGVADGAPRAVKVAASRPDLVTAVVCPGGMPLSQAAIAEMGVGLAASDSVVAAIIEQLTNDYRGALRSLVTSTNPQMSEDEVRERVKATVEYSPHEPAVARLRAWVADDSRQEGLALGDRLWLLMHPDNPWFPVELLPRVRELLPAAHVMEAEAGPISRPDIAAGVVRKLTARIDAPAAAS